MRTRASALPAIILTILLTSTIAFAQVRQNPTNPVNPGTHRYEQPTTIVIPSPPPYGVTQESTVVDLNTGTVTIIQQTGNETFILRP